MTRVRRGRALPRAAWGMADQGVSAISNVLLTIMVARSSTPHELGEFSLVYIVFVLVLGLTRSRGGGVLAIEYADDQAELLKAAPRCTGYYVGVGLCLAFPGLLLSSALGPGDGHMLAIVCLALPLMLLQDAYRSLFFCQGRPSAAFANDLVWLLAEIVLLGVAIAPAGAPGTATLVACWAIAGVIAALVGIVQTGVVPWVASPLQWLRAHGRIAWPLVLSGFLTQLPAHLVYLTLPLVASVSDLGVIRAAYVFFGPLGVVNSGAAMLALPHAVTVRKRGDVPAMGRRVSLTLAGVSCLWAALVVALPEPVGRAIVGPSWDDTLVTRLLLGVSIVAEAVLVGQVAALSALRDTRRLARIRSVSAPVTVAVSLGLAAMFGAAGAAAGFAIGYWTAAVLAWALLLLRPPVGRRLVMRLQMPAEQAS
jgi:O-antigen/teichoic acid export membrane protein